VEDTYNLLEHALRKAMGIIARQHERQGERFDAWLHAVEPQGIAELKNFAQGLKRDYDAVKAGLTLEWSNGPRSGHVHRLKLLKMQAYGRASFDQLRKRVLRCAYSGGEKG
jgi:transposase